MADNKINVGGRLHSIATGNVLGGANEIFDDSKNKKQSDINTETYSLVNDVNERLSGLSPDQQSALTVAAKATNNETKLGYYVCGTEGNLAAKVISDATGYILSKGGSIKIKMTNANTANNATLNINSTGAKALYYDGERASAKNSWEAGETIEVYYDGTSFYANSVAGGSGSGDGVFDVSVKYPTSGVEGGNTYTLEGALAVLNANLPASKKKGGMSIKFVQSSDNKYIQARCMAQNFTTDVTQWQGVDTDIIAGSKNLAESGGVDKAVKNFSDTQDALFMLTKLMEFKTTRYNSSASTYLSTGLLNANEFYVLEFVNNSNSDFHSSILYISNGANTANYKVRDYLDIPAGDKYCVPIIPSVDTTYVNTNIQFVPEISVSVYKYPNKDYYKAINALEDFAETPINYTIGYRYFLGEVPRVPNNDSACAEVSCAAGDTFLVYGQSFNASRLWYFLDSSNNILEQGTGTNNNGFHIIIAPANSAKLLLNVDKSVSYFAYKASGKVVSNSSEYLYKELISVHGEEVLYLNVGAEYRGSAIGETISYTTNAGTDNSRCTKISCSEGDVFLVSGESKGVRRTYALLDSSDKIVEIAESYTTIIDRLVIIPAGVTSIVINDDISDRKSYRGSSEISRLYHKVSDNKTEFVGTPVNFTQNKRYTGYHIGETCTISTNNDSKCALIAVSEGDIFRITGTGASASRLWYYLDSSNKILDMALSTITVKDLVLTIPSGVSYLAVSVLKDGGECYKGVSVVSGIANKIPQYSYDIPTLYNTEEHKSKLQNLIFGTATRIANYKPITFLHFSDLHKQNYLFARIVQYKKLYSTAIDDIINTGDLVDYYTDAIDQSVGQWNEGKATLSVIGNHDTRDSVNTSDWTAHAGIDAYNKFIAPYIENWGNVVQPENAATVGKCYYYKDYTIDGNKLRLIVLDNMVMNSNLANYDSAQITWFESVLSDAKNNSYTVVGAQHFPTAMTKWDSAWCSKDHDGEGWAGMDVFFDAVNTFIGEGGKFACWITGHTHNNLLGTAKVGTTEYTNQIVIAVDCSKIDPSNQFVARVNNTKTMDCFNLISFDIRSKLIKVVRVGADYDRYMRHAGVLCINYENKSIVYEQ